MTEAVLKETAMIEAVFNGKVIARVRVAETK